MSRHLASIATIVVVLAVAGPASADPVTRVISPNGSGIECSMALPCSYGYAFTFGSNAGDTVLALPGTYDVTAAPPDVAHPLTIMGDPSKPRPVFENYDPSNVWAFNLAGGAGGSVLKHLDIRGHNGLYVHQQVDASDLAITAQSYCIDLAGPGSTLTDSTLTVTSPVQGARCADIQAPSTMRHLTVNTPGATGIVLDYGGSTLEDSSITADYPLLVSNGSKTSDVRRVSLVGAKQVVAAMQFGWVNITDSLLWTTGTAVSAVDTQRGGKATLRNDTVIAAGAGSIGLDAEAAMSSMPPGTIDARNVIVHANADDLRSLVAPDLSKCTPAPCAPGDLRIDHSLFTSAIGPVVDGGANVSGDPKFVDAALGNFRLQSGSPAIDAGVVDAFTGSTDLDGAARVQGQAVDLGAFEAPASPSTPVADQPAPTTQTPPADQPAAKDLTPPVLSGARVSNRVFAVGRGATALSAVKRGTTLRYRVSEAAQVTIDIARRATKTRYRHVATLTRRAQAGPNSAKLSGRIKTRALKPGSYRLKLTARDAAGNLSRPVTVKFTVVA